MAGVLAAVTGGWAHFPLILPSLTFGIALLVVGPAYGLAVGAAIRIRAARRWAERGPEVLQVLAAGRG